MKKYFCDNLTLKKEALRIAYLCRITNKVCPHVRYSVDGEASPDVLFTKKGCGLDKKEESKSIVKEKVEEKVTVEKVREEIETKVEEIKVEEAKDIEEVTNVINNVQKQNYAKKKKKPQQKK